MSNTSDFDEVVQYFMNEFGTSAFILQNVQGIYDTTTSSVQTSVNKIAVNTLQFDYIPRKYGSTFLDNSLIQEGDKEILVQPVEKSNPDALPFVVNPSTDSYMVGNQTYKIVAIKSYNPSNSDNILYVMYVRI